MHVIDIFRAFYIRKKDPPHGYHENKTVYINLQTEEDIYIYLL